MFTPRPQVDSAVVRLVRRGPAPDEKVATLVRAAFAHRRKPLAGSIELAGGPEREATREALRGLGVREDARAEALSPAQFAELAALVRG